MAWLHWAHGRRVKGGPVIRNAKEFGAAVRRARKQRGLNQSALAARCGVNISFIVDLEAGKATIQLDKALTVAVELGFRLPDAPAPQFSPQVAEPAPEQDDELGHIPSF
jgi:transcriptional regulator with XRE-family HTH domain